MGARSVQTRLAAEAEDILQRHYGKACGRTLRQANQPPVWTIFAGTNQGENGSTLLFAESRPPPQRSVVVVRAGVDHAICAEPMWKVGVGADIAESELQNGHARNLVPVAEFDYVGRDQAKVFGKKRQSTKFLAKFVEELIAGAVYPLAFDRRGLAGRNLPELGKPAKVIKPNKVASLRGPAKALHPPLIAKGTNRSPVV